MHPSIELFCKVSLRYETQKKNAIAQELTENLKHEMSTSKLNLVKKELKTKIIKQRNIAKKVAQTETTPLEHAKRVHQRNLMKFIITELRMNMSPTTMLKKRIRIATQVLRKIESGFAYLDAKNELYKKHGVYVTYEVPLNEKATTMENMGMEREFDEMLNQIVYGWDDAGEALYYPTFGASTIPPEYKKAGPIWKRVLNNRWEQMSDYDDDDMLETYTGI